MHSECLFCKIIKGQIPAEKVYEDEMVFAFSDIKPAAPLHILIIPKEHIPSLAHVLPSQQQLLGHIQLVASKIAKLYPQTKNGFRLVANSGKDAGQTVFHLHYHLLAGRDFGWPPG
ncbi:MAG: histidine triad nucleotide-binding protein [Elusimicrobiota bacterium]|jgi:histidine triad (HIT) family protein|nr:histidine triad nucleotide-binding protein [Elusimicrobiota bacterium]